MARDIEPSESHRSLERRTFSALFSVPIVLVAAIVLLVALWAPPTLSMIVAVPACAAVVAIGLPIGVLLAKRNRHRKLPGSF